VPVHHRAAAVSGQRNAHGDVRGRAWCLTPRDSGGGGARERVGDEGLEARRRVDQALCPASGTTSSRTRGSRARAYCQSAPSGSTRSASPRTTVTGPGKRASAGRKRPHRLSRAARGVLRFEAVVEDPDGKYLAARGDAEHEPGACRPVTEAVVVRGRGIADGWPAGYERDPVEDPRVVEATVPAAVHRGDPDATSAIGVHESVRQRAPTRPRQRLLHRPRLTARGVH
jgi:hypothetical protein